MPDPDDKPIHLQVPIRYHYPDNLTTHFVNNLIIQHEPESFVISFFESFKPPILGNTREERLAKMEAIEYLDAKCVARIVVTPAAMREFVSAMADNLNRHQRRFGEEALEEGDEQ